MAVYQGARLRTDRLAATRTSVRGARAAAPAPVATSPRVRPMGLLMAVIVAATMLGLVYLTQTLGTSTTSAEIYDLETTSRELFSDTRTLQLQALKLTEADTIVLKANKQKLKNLGEIVVLRAP
ncbi:MAG: hypothetical protein AB1Z67_08655 [Candidatus Limnocylindrales bacterium]